MRIAITGGCGFIGSNFVRYMAEKYLDYDLVVIDKLTYAADLNNIKDLIDSKRIRFFEHDITNEEDMFDDLYMCHAVVNFAAESHVGRAIVKSNRHIRSNVIGAATIAEIATNYHMRMVQISTDEVYGEIKEGSFNENYPLHPRNRYAGSKAAAEVFTYSFLSPPHNLDIVYTRSANNFGKYQSQEKFTHVIAESIAKNRPIPLHGEGKEIRDWLWVIDNCKAIDLVLHLGATGEFYNISAHNELSNDSLAEMAIRNFGGKIKLMENRPGNDYRYSLDTNKIEMLGWEPEAKGMAFEPYMVDTLKWYIEKYKKV